MLRIADPLPYESRSQVIADYASEVTSSGVRLHVDRDCFPGMVVAFEVSLVTGVRVLAGEGVVRWAGTTADGSAMAGVEFTSLEPLSFNVLDELLAYRGQSAWSLEPPAPPEGFLHGKRMRAFAAPRVAPLTPVVEAELEFAAA